MSHAGGCGRRAGAALAVLLLAACLGLGTAIFRDYGIHWDHEVNRDYGLGSLHAYFELLGRSPPPEVEAARRRVVAKHEQIRGPAFELLLAVAELGLTSGDPREVAFVRHLGTFVAFAIGVVFFFALCSRHFESRALGMLGALALLLTPRIFAHAFYDSTDIAFLSLFVASSYTLLRLLERPTLGWATAHALASALLVDVRNVGALVPALTVGLAAVEVLRERRPGAKLRELGAPIAVYLCALALLVPLFWPHLWGAPISRWVDSLRRAADTGWGLPVLYMGRFVPGSRVPWHYNPVWMAITIPIPYLAAFALGAWVIARDLLRAATPWRRRRGEIVFVAWLGIPLVAPILLGSTLYDDWRHHYFVYPALLAIALTGVELLWQSARSGTRRLGRGLAGAALAGLAAGVFAVAAFMVRNHPHQNVYFNALAGGDLRRRFELDYWGLSYRRGLEFILASDPRPVVKVAVANLAGGFNASILPAGERRRLRFVDVADADYFVSNFRWHPRDYPYPEEIHAIEVDGEKILAVYRVRARTPGGERLP